jgi:TPR repeat protein
MQNLNSYKLSCDKGVASGCFGLGYMYENGMGVAKNKVTAREYYAITCDLKYDADCKSYARMKG